MQSDASRSMVEMDLSCVRATCVGWAKKRRAQSPPLAGTVLPAALDGVVAWVGLVSALNSKANATLLAVLWVRAGRVRMWATSSAIWDNPLLDCKFDSCRETGATARSPPCVGSGAGRWMYRTQKLGDGRCRSRRRVVRVVVLACACIYVHTYVVVVVGVVVSQHETQHRCMWIEPSTPCRQGECKGRSAPALTASM